MTYRFMENGYEGKPKFDNGFKNQLGGKRTFQYTPTTLFILYKKFDL